MQQQINLLEDVKSHFDHWRATRTKRGKIPDCLWDKVKLLIGHYSLTDITEALSINTNQMRVHLDLKDEIKFVEVNTGSLPTQKKLINRSLPKVVNESKTCSVEVHKPSGNILKVNDCHLESVLAIIVLLISTAMGPFRHHSNGTTRLAS